MLFQKWRRPRSPLLDAKRVALGAGGVEQEAGWIGSDQDDLDITDRRSFARLWKPGTREGFVAEHVWEHLTIEAAQRATANCFEFLKSGGRLRIAVPDGNFPDEAYIEHVRPGGSGPGADDHKVLWTDSSLGGLLRQVGFQTSEVEWWDAQGVFHSRPWSRQDGLIRRSEHFDERNKNGRLCYTSLIVDGVKP